MFKYLKKFIFWYVVLAIIFIVSFVQLKKLPSKNKIVDALMNEPIQAKSTSLENFDFEYRNVIYKIKPVVDYELWGLVVSVNNINAWFNIYHNKNSFNIKDVCVIWGDNLKTNAYLDVKFKSEEVTCYYHYGKELKGKFYGNKLSNNHLLASDVIVGDVIRDIKIGDQIHLEGALVNYAKGNSIYYRNSSLTRDDTGNGACEVLFVKEVEILKKVSRKWYFLNDWSKRIFIILIFLQIVVFFRKSLSKKNVVKSEFNYKQYRNVLKNKRIKK